MTLSPAGRTQLVVAIDEKNLHLLALGQKAVVSADAYPQQRFAAEVAYINPGVNALTGSVDVKLAVSAPPAVLSQDMTVSIDIEVARHPAVLLLATGAVHDADGPSPWVLRVEGGAATRRPIRLGLRSAGFVEVVEGLQSGDRVIPVAAALAAGDRLRIMAPVP
jgi:HlyD family secretion protein